MSCGDEVLVAVIRQSALQTWRDIFAKQQRKRSQRSTNTQFNTGHYTSQASHHMNSIAFTFITNSQEMSLPGAGPLGQSFSSQLLMQFSHADRRTGRRVHRQLN